MEPEEAFLEKLPGGCGLMVFVYGVCMYGAGGRMKHAHLSLPTMHGISASGPSHLSGPLMTRVERSLTRFIIRIIRYNV